MGSQAGGGSHERVSRLVSSVPAMGHQPCFAVLDCAHGEGVFRPWMLALAHVLTGQFSIRAWIVKAALPSSADGYSGRPSGHTDTQTPHTALSTPTRW